MCSIWSREMKLQVSDRPGAIQMCEAQSIRALTSFIFMDDEPATVDLAIVLGSPSISNVEPAIDLYLKGFTKKIVISGHGPSPESVPEWRIYRDHALAAGVPSEALMIEPNARNTLENFLFTAKVITQHTSWDKISRIAICCKPIHTRRAFMTARKHFPGHVKLFMCPPRDPADLQAHNWSQTVIGRDRVLGEVRHIAEYGMKRDLSID